MNVHTHADASPSSSSIWIPCPASVTQARGKVRKSTPYTREGSAAHHLAELKLKGLKAPVLGQTITIEGEDIPVTEEMVEAVDFYVNECRQAATGASLASVETRVHLTHDGEDVFGTCDHFAYHDGTAVYSNTLYVTDFKYGQGVLVSPDSSQLKIYALGVLNALGPFAEVERIVLTVVQPRNGGTSHHVMTCKELTDWEFAVLYPAMDKIAANDNTETPGDHCRWCVRAGECKALAALAMAKAKVAFKTIPPDPTGLTNDELGEILEHAELIAAWVTKVRAEVSGRLDNGQKVPGWKLVAKRAMRKIVSETAALAEILRHGIGWDEVTRIETLGVIEKVLKAHKVEASVLDPFIVKESSGSTLVPENNPREAIANDPASVFN